MKNVDIEQLEDKQKCDLVTNRWDSSSSVWDVVSRIYKQNTDIYGNNPQWLQYIPHVRQKWTIQANRIFVNMEAVINSLIANPAGINVLPAREGDEAQELARDIQGYLTKRFSDLNIKETVRMGLRNLYFGRLIVIKAFWNPITDDFDYRAIDPRKVRFGKYARKEQDSEFAIEEIEDNLCSVIDRFPSKKQELMQKFGMKDDAELYIKNPDVIYKEAWIGDYVICKLDNIILDCFKNPYWDWEGILVTDEEQEQLENETNPKAKREKLTSIKLEQESRKAEYTQPTKGATYEEVNEYEGGRYKTYMFNYFDHPRKPYIFATIFNNENSPIGRTDMITLSSELQRAINKRKMDIDENCEMANGILKVDAEVMGKSDAQRIRWETRGVIWGKGVRDGVTRETGQSLPAMVFEDMQDSRSEIDNIMAATSAFRGERQGQETKAGRLALIQQSYLRLNELTQLVDYVYKEIYEWSLQMIKTRYTEAHIAKWIGADGAQKITEIMQDDIESGSEVIVIPGKTLPVDDEFKFEQAQNDVLNGFISPVDYLKIAKYDNPDQLSRNAVLYKQNPMEAVGIPEQEMPLPYQPGQPTPEQVASIIPPETTPQEMQPQIMPEPVQNL
mgnify:CR=1 FL=1